MKFTLSVKTELAALWEKWEAGDIDLVGFRDEVENIRARFPTQSCLNINGLSGEEVEALEKR